MIEEEEHSEDELEFQDNSDFIETNYERVGERKQRKQSRRDWNFREEGKKWKHNKENSQRHENTSTLFVIKLWVDLCGLKQWKNREAPALPGVKWSLALALAFLLYLNNLITESEVVTGKSQTFAYRIRLGLSLRFSRGELTLVY